MPALSGSGTVPPLRPLYDGPYVILRRGTCAFTLQVGQGEEIIAVSRLKACTDVDATPGSPRRCSRPLGPGATAMPAAACPGRPAASKWVSFFDTLVSSSSQQEQLRICQGTVFLLPRGEVFACPGSAAPLQPLLVPAVPAETPYEDRPLTSSAFLPRPVPRGEHCGGCLHPWFVVRPAW
jgi:hypothetical protein